MAMERTHNDPFTFEIAEHLVVISKKENGWTKELNLVSWNGQQPPKFDIREWSPDHTKMSKGITFFDGEMRKLSQAYFSFCNARKVSEGRNSRNAAAEAGMRAGEEAARMQEEAEAKAASQTSDTHVQDTEALQNAEAMRSAEESEPSYGEDDFDLSGAAESSQSAPPSEFASLAE